MIARVWLINGILAVILVFCVGNAWDAWHEPPGGEADQISEAGGKKFRPVKMAPEKRLETPAAYADVVDKNLFAPDRMPPQPPPADAVPEVKEVAEDVKIAGEKVELYGVIILDAYKKALTNDPSDRSIPYRWIREGDAIGNLSVREINADNILLTDAEKAYRVLLYDPEKTAKAARKSPSRSSAEEQPQVVSAGAPPKPANHQPAASAETKVSAPADTEDEYEIIDTPFGEIKRKKRK